MPDWVVEMLQGPAYAIGNAIWEVVMDMIFSIATTSPMAFSKDAWKYTQEMYKWSLGMGLSLMNIFFLIGFFRQVSNLRENITTEILVEQLIKLILANALMLSGLKIIKEFFTVAAKLTKEVLTKNMPPITTDNLDVGSWLFFFVFGMLYVICAVVCGIIMLLTIFGRYLKLYISTVLSPVAISTLAGGRGFENSAYAWIKSFLVNVFEIVVIALTMTIAGKMIGSIDWGKASGDIASMADGFISCIEGMFTMVLLTSAVKGADVMLKRSFGL